MSLAHENQIYRYAEKAERERRKAMAETTPIPNSQGTCDHEHDVKQDMSFMLFADSPAQERRENGIFD